jgi:hypothetical protein
MLLGSNSILSGIKPCICFLFLFSHDNIRAETTDCYVLPFTCRTISEACPAVLLSVMLQNSYGRCVKWNVHLLWRLWFVSCSSYLYLISILNDNSIKIFKSMYHHHYPLKFPPCYLFDKIFTIFLCLLIKCSFQICIHCVPTVFHISFCIWSFLVSPMVLIQYLQFWKKYV